MNAWQLELIIVRDGSAFGGERSALTRDVERGLLVRLRRGVYVERSGYESLTLEERHIVQMRGIAAVAHGRVVFSHFSAAVLHGLPVLWDRLHRVHFTVTTAAERGREGAAGHVFPLREDEVVQVGGLFATSVPRTVVDVAGGAPFGEGLMVADAALRQGLPRALLEQAVEIAGPRQSWHRIKNVVAVAHPGSESAAESYSRSNMIHLGYEPPELQYVLWDSLGFVAALDFFFRRYRVGGEADGLKKFLDPKLAPQGAGRVVYNEKLREDRALPLIAGLARWGWPESVSAPRLRQKLASVGVHPAEPRATIADYAAAARDARPRFVARRPVVTP